MKKKKLKAKLSRTEEKLAKAKTKLDELRSAIKQKTAVKAGQSTASGPAENGAGSAAAPKTPGKTTIKS